MDQIINEDLLTEVTTPGAGVPTSSANGNNVKPIEQTNEVTPGEIIDKKDNKTEVANFLPSIKRETQIRIDDNNNFEYSLKNGKVLKTTVKKPSLAISTELSDVMLRIGENPNGDRYMLINNMAVYQLVMDQIIRVILVDGAPIHGTVSFDKLSQIGMTKAELDDFMGIITTFHLDE